MKFFAIMLLTVGLFGCSVPDPSGFLHGEVVWIDGNLSSLEENPEVSGLFSYSNETVRLGNPRFVFGVQTEEGIYTIQLDPTDRGSTPGPQTLQNLAATIKVGTMIRFPTELHGRRAPAPDNSPMGFSSSRIGMLDPDDIELLPQ